MRVTEDQVRFKAARSSGPGGQRANRRSTKVQLWVEIGHLPLTDIQKKRIRKKLGKHINHRDELFVENEEERSQEVNRERALEHLNKLIADALRVPRKRIPTTPPRRAEEVRIRAKKFLSAKKEARKAGNW